MQIDTSTQLDLPKPFRGVGGAYIDLDCYLHHRLYFQLQLHHRQMFFMCHKQYLLELDMNN